MSAAPKFIPGVRTNAPLSTTDKVAAIVDLLKYQVGHAGMKLSELEEALSQQTGAPVVLAGDMGLWNSLKSNEKLTEHGGVFTYNSVYQLQDARDLLRRLEQEAPVSADSNPKGIRIADLDGTYAAVERDVEALIRSGQVIVIEGKQVKGRDSGRTLFPRMDQSRNTFELSGVCTVVPGSRKVATSVDLRPEIYRGDLIMIEGRRFRVSTRVASSGPFMPKPLIHMRERGAVWSAATDPPPPNSSASQTDGYADTFSDSELPLDAVWDGPALAGVPAYRLGAHAFMRQIWHDINEKKDKTPDSHALLREYMEKEGMPVATAEAGSFEILKHKHVPRKRKQSRTARKRSAQKLMQGLSHLQGTEIGAAIAEHIEKGN